MSSVGASLKDSSRRQYISTGDFTGQFFTYATSVNASLVTVGALTAIVADAYAFQPGHILRETGRKLIEGVNPGLVDPNSGSVYTYLVGVYDANSCLSGFIDPNCSVFAPYNSDKPYFLDTTAEAVDASVDPAIKDEGAPVYTNGDITSILGNIVASNGNITASEGSISAGTYVSGGLTTLPVFLTGFNGVAYSNVAANSNADIFINPTLANVFTLDLTGTGYTSLSNTVNVYCSLPASNGGAPSNVSPLPQAEYVTLVVRANSNATANQPTFRAATNTRMIATKVGSNAYTTLSFVTCGTDMMQTASAVGI
jgi:hypothetical protein